MNLKNQNWNINHKLMHERFVFILYCLMIYYYYYYVSKYLFMFKKTINEFYEGRLKHFYALTIKMSTIFVLKTAFYVLNTKIHEI